jgi:primosomal replication protein N
MSEQNNENPQQYPEQLSDVLLVMDKEKKKIQAVTGIDENGNLKTVDADKKNQNQFMRVDKSGDLFSNFFSNFWRQLKNPTHFNFFKVPASEAVDTAKQMQKQVDTPTKEGEAVMQKHEVKEPKEHQQENKAATETAQTTPETTEYRFKEENVDWKTLNELGLSKERLEKAGVLDTLLKGYKTNILMPVSINFGSAVIRSEARLGLHLDDKGNTVLAIHGVRKEPNLNTAFFGHEFTKEDKDNLLNTGNMGRVVDLTNPKTGEKIPSIISIDKLTNEVIALRQDWMKIPDEIKGVKLNEEQKQTLLDGKPLHLEGMMSKKDKSFDANVQYNADKRFVEFLFDKSNNNRQSQNQQVNQQQGQSQENPKLFRGKEFSDEQYKKLTEGKTVYVSDFKDGKGQPYKGYVTLNAETGKYDFNFRNPDKLKDKIVPAEAHKTQVAVNSEGKTNEATKNINEPLKSQQTTPANKQQQEKQETPKPAKSKGVRR